MAGKTATDIMFSSDPEIGFVFGKNINITGLKFCGVEENDPSWVEYVNKTINCNMLGYSMKDGRCYKMFKGEGEPVMFYDPAKWFFFMFNYDQKIEEESHVAAYNPERRKLDILHINYSATENWWIEKATWVEESTWLIRF